MKADITKTFLLPKMSEREAAGRLTSIPGIVEAEAKSEAPNQTDIDAMTPGATRKGITESELAEIIHGVENALLALEAQIETSAAGAAEDLKSLQTIEDIEGTVQGFQAAMNALVAQPGVSEMTIENKRLAILN